ncbi:hypothetical protein JAAARDRAFT_147890 [Jaapia argillacea MUCL 33604]|uniref:Cytochrome P450 n=1 Tax=Jaapia argillacea MUCL 33604 TaxID=933084 RepID=A0A067QJ28_9AGAM|nr:hypothetical protein JAAARDRAFT_147890 [Jaapia argillacea MUCL 33604]
MDLADERPTVVFGAIAIASLVAYVLWSTSQAPRLPLPPGPKGLPFIGNVRDLPKELPWLTYTEWAANYGELVYVEVFGRGMLILNSVKAITDLFDKRSSNYSDRPPMYMVNELIGWDWDFAHMHYGDWWRKHRKTFHQYFHPNAIVAYRPIQIKETHALLRRLLVSPERFIPHVRQHAGSIILQVAYGYKIESEDDYYVDLAGRAMEGLISAGNAGTYLVDFIPILKYVPPWMPGASFMRKALQWRKPTIELKEAPFKLVKEAMVQNTATPSFCSTNLEKLTDESPPDEEEVIKNCAGIAYLAGSDTTVSVVTTFILAMVLHPEVQKRAQADLDAVVGVEGRLPDFEDRSRLPFIDAIISETLRWHPVTPLALAHASMEDDVYEGYFIPAGTTITGNAWAILHDPSMYPDPSAFKPERFLKREGGECARDPMTVAFGFGRRICPGRHLAEASVWIAIVSILSTFDIGKAVDSEGHDIEPKIEYHSGLVSHPMPFICSIEPRSEAARKLVDSTVDD